MATARTTFGETTNVETDPQVMKSPEVSGKQKGCGDMEVLGTGVEGASRVLIEVDPVTVNEIGAQRALEGIEEGRTEDALKKLKEIGDSIAEVCQSVHGAVASGITATKPDEFTLEFGVKIAGEGSAIISKVSGEAALKVTATWRTD